MSCYCIVYVSETTVDLSENSLLQLLRQARTEHEQWGLNGVLLHSEGRFLQVLEGEAGRVREFFARIAADPRHYKLQVLADGPKLEADFPDWCMCFDCPSGTCASLPNYRTLAELLEMSEHTTVRPLFTDFLAEGIVPVL